MQPSSSFLFVSHSLVSRIIHLVYFCFLTCLHSMIPTYMLRTQTEYTFKKKRQNKRAGSLLIVRCFGQAWPWHGESESPGSVSAPGDRFQLVPGAWHRSSHGPFHSGLSRQAWEVALTFHILWWLWGDPTARQSQDSNPGLRDFRAHVFVSSQHLRGNCFLETERRVGKEAWGGQAALGRRCPSAGFREAVLASALPGTPLLFVLTPQHLGHLAFSSMLGYCPIKPFF